MKHTITLIEHMTLGCSCDIDIQCDCDSYPTYALAINGKTGYGYVESTDEGYLCSILGASFPIATFGALSKELKVRFACFGEITCNL